MAQQPLCVKSGQIFFSSFFVLSFINDLSFLTCILFEAKEDATNTSSGIVEKPKVFKLGPETTDAIRQYQQCVPPTEPHMFLFPDKNDPEVLEELYMNPPPESDEIQLGKQMQSFDFFHIPQK